MKETYLAYQKLEPISGDTADQGKDFFWLKSALDWLTKPPTTISSKPFPVTWDTTVAATPLWRKKRDRGGTNSACILQLDFEHLHGSGDNHLAGPSPTTSKHFLQQCQLLPGKRWERNTQKESQLNDSAALTCLWAKQPGLLRSFSLSFKDHRRGKKILKHTFCPQPEPGLSQLDGTLCQMT